MLKWHFVSSVIEELYIFRLFKDSSGVFLTSYVSHHLKQTGEFEKQQ